MTNENIHTSKAMASLESVYDPEIALNVVDLGLIYEIVISENEVKCVMTLTSQNCPMGESIVSQVEQKLKDTFPEKDIHVELTYNPPWGPERISESGREFLSQ